MSKEVTSGQCRLCGRTFGKRQMTTHLKSCWSKQIETAPGSSAKRWFHLVVEGKYASDYWLHAQAPANSTFGNLDQMLRSIWLECCGHLSAFQLPVKRPPRGRLDPFSMASVFNSIAAGDFGDGTADDDQLMQEKLGSKLQPGMEFTHDYDFGTTTKLKLRVAGEYTAPAMKGKIKVLARNDPPQDPCAVCGKPATQICSECVYQGQGEFCDACAEKHECGEEMLMPLVNSPRTGMCGYCGPSIEP